MMGFVTFKGEAEQYLCAAVLRPGNVTAAAGEVGILRRRLNIETWVTHRQDDSDDPDAVRKRTPVQARPGYARATQ